MHLAFMVLSVRRPQTDQPGITPWMTWLPGPWPPPAFRSQRNLKVLAVQTESGPTVSLASWQAGKPLTSDVAVVCPLPIRTLPQQARSRLSSRSKVRQVYTELDTRCSFQSVAVETLGPINDSARKFLYNLLRKISLQSGDDKRGQLFVSANLCPDSVIQCYSATWQLCPGGGLTVIPAPLHSVA